MRIRFFFATLLLLTLAFPAAAADERLTIAAIYDPAERIQTGGSVASGVQWIDDRSYLWPRTNERGEVVELLAVDAGSGRTRVVMTPDRFSDALRDSIGTAPDEARRIFSRAGWVLSPDRSRLLLNLARDLWLFELSTARVQRLTSTEAEEKVPSFSPDGKRISFVRDNDLYVVAADGSRERRLTTSGSSEILNGILDWVYQEEIYGRNNFHGHWWSPDSRRIAFLQLDESRVPHFTLIDDIPYHQRVEVMRYPKAGDPNPGVKLFVVDAVGGAPRAIDTSKYTSGDHLIVSVGWTADGRSVSYQVQNRIQTWLDLNTANPVSGDSRTLFRDATPAWIKRTGEPKWLRDGSFLWLTEREGAEHIYHYRADGTLVRKLTDGPWEVSRIEGVDEGAGWVWFTANERSVHGSDVYRVRLDGGAPQRLTARAGTNSATFSPKMSWFTGRWSDIGTPVQTRLHRGDGAEVRMIDENRVPQLARYRLSKPEFVTIPARDGVPLDAVLIRPPDFDPGRKYPVFQATYAGPQAPQVRNGWGGPTHLFYQYLAQNGFVVFIADNRTATGRGAAGAWPLYRNFGELELRDLEDAANWLAAQPWADGERMLLSGWSFGGYMVSYALTHSRRWQAGIAGGSVTDWRDYDSIYTERYMGLPQENPEGYRKSSPRFAAAGLHGELLLIHGLLDDNVHPQNTIQFADELMKAGKQFRMMMYPRSRHGITDPKLVQHMRTLMFEFAKETVGTGKGEEASGH
jgi:dipeptidyl-peptidase 4